MAGDPFYESGFYSYYAQSFFHDLDFNLINQVPRKMSWLVTNKYHHPDFHPLIQTPFIYFFYLFENIGHKLINYNFESHYKLLLSGLVINLFLLIIIFKCSRKLLQTYLKTDTLIPLLTVMLGSTFFYFSFFNINVADIFAISCKRCRTSSISFWRSPNVFKTK
jgi:hypothetical protein